MVWLRNATKDDYSLDLDVNEDQRQYVASYKSILDYAFIEQDKEHTHAYIVCEDDVAVGKTMKSILISCATRLDPFDIKELRELTEYDEMNIEEIPWTEEEGSQFIIVTHSPILLGIHDSEILSFDDGKIHPCSYEDTDSYKITEMFINDRKRILHQLLDCE